MPVAYSILISISPFRLWRAGLFEKRKRRRPAAGRVDDEVRRERLRLPLVLFKSDCGNPAVVRRRNQLGDARARAKLDVGFLHEAPPADALNQGARHAEQVEAEVAPGERLGSRSVQSNVATAPHGDGAGIDEVKLDAREERLQRFLASREQRVGVSRLRRSGARRRPFGQRVAIEHENLFEIGRDALRRGQASHAGSDDDGVFCEQIGHSRLSQMC